MSTDISWSIHELPPAVCSGGTKYAVGTLVNPVLRMWSTDDLEELLQRITNNNGIELFNKVDDLLKKQPVLYNVGYSGDAPTDPFCVTDVDPSTSTYTWISWYDWFRAIYPMFANITATCGGESLIGLIQATDVVDTFLPIPIPPSSGIAAAVKRANRPSQDSSDWYSSGWYSSDWPSDGSSGGSRDDSSGSTGSSGGSSDNSDNEILGIGY